MKIQLITLLLVACGFVSQAQQTKETYYKDYYLDKQVDEKDAVFKKVETKTEDGVNTVQVFNLAKGCVVKERSYKGNIPVGVWTKYTEDCILTQKRDFSKLVYSDKRVDSLFNNEINDNNADNYEIARYGDNEKAIFQYIGSNIRYPNEAKDAGASGTVYLQFIIKADGSIKMVSIVRSAHPFLDLESWDLIEKMPKWNPAKKGGIPIDSYYILPIKFTFR